MKRGGRLEVKGMDIFLVGYIHLEPHVTSIFEGQPIKTRLFPTKTRVIWVLGIYLSIYIYMYKNNFISLLLDQYTETLLFFLSIFYDRRGFNVLLSCQDIQLFLAGKSLKYCVLVARGTCSTANI